ncbi:hypothetical protein BJY01DRAFT_226972 [Aspergillus pseudoustus]|uniref:Uncharacterized protein n=1 Tax=Aspergillus pseudoustus TaxID=1810923 RepID=A0ABR4ITU3_9EURO
MPRSYTVVDSGTPRSFLFAVVANVGPGSASRTLAVAYRKGSGMGHVVADTLALIDVLSDPANRAPLEAERSLAEDWYRCQTQSQSHAGRENKTENSIERPCIPDTPPPPFVHCCDRRRYHRAERQRPPELPWRDDGASGEFPFTTTCLLLGLLRETEDHNAELKADAFRSNHNRTRPSDVQLQPLDTVFRGNCLEYGLVVLDISDLDAGVKYGIVAFPYKYMADVYYWSDIGGWDPVEDPPPEKEPDIVPTTRRPRVPLSILQWVHMYDYYGLREDPSVLRLDAKPRVNAISLDYIWPPELESQEKEASSDGILSRFSWCKWITCVWPRSYKSTNLHTVKTDFQGPAPLTLPGIPAGTKSHQPRRNPDVDCAIDDLLILIKADVSHLDEGLLHGFQKLPELPEHLRRRLEEAPDSLLGPSSEGLAHILRIAYAGCTHLNWVLFKKLAPRVIAAAIATNELRDALALSICVDNFHLDQDEEGLNDLAAALAQSTTLKQLCILQRPDSDNDDASARFCAKLLSSGDLHLLRGKTIYSTCAFSAPLRGRNVTPQSTTSATSASPVAQVVPAIHMFTFNAHQNEGIADTDYSQCYNMGNNFLHPEGFAARFLSHLRSAGSGSGSDKAIMQFSRGVAPSLTSTANTTTDNDNSTSSSSSSGRFAMGPIPAGFFGTRASASDHNQSRARRVRLGDIHPGSWVVLLEQQGLDSSGNFDGDDDDGYYDKEEDDIVLRYSFITIRQTSADIAPADHEQQEQRHTPDLVPDHNPNPNLIDVVGGLIDFLHLTIPALDTSTWEKRVEEAERDFLASARDLQKRRSYERTKDMDIFTWERRMIEVDRRRAAGLPEITRREPSVDVGVLDEGRVSDLLGRLL